MNEQKLTPWFPAHVRPVRKGVYQVLDGELMLRFYCYWDGRQWYYGSSEWCLSDSGYRSWKTSPWRESDSALKQWRGLAKDPS